jgi:hypothetical protein
MPFRKISSGKDKGKFKSPRGKVYTAAQVRAYYAKTRKKGKK